MEQIKTKGLILKVINLNDNDRIYKMIFDGYEFAFTVKDEILTVSEVIKL